MATGTIKRIARDKGFGFIRDNSGQEWFFHRSSVQGSFDALNEGLIADEDDLLGFVADDEAREVIRLELAPDDRGRRVKPGGSDH